MVKPTAPATPGADVGKGRQSNKGSNSLSSYWESVFKLRAKATSKASEATVSQMMRIIFPEFRLKIVRHFYEAAKMDIARTVGYLIAASELEPVRNIVEGTELLDDLTSKLVAGEADHLFSPEICEEMNQLIAAMVDVSRDMMEGSVSPLHMAAVCDLPLAIKFLIDRGAHTETVDMEGATPLFLAVAIDRARIVRALCEVGANVEFRKARGNTVLFMAAASGNREPLQILLEFGADPNKPHWSGSTPLWIAASMGYCDCVKDLLDHRAYKNEPVNMRSVVELDDSCSDSIKAVIKALDSRGKLKKPEGGWTEEDGKNLMGVLAEASSKKGTASKEGGSQGASSVITKEGATPIWIAACNGHAEVCGLLLERGANVELTCDGTTPLWIAACNGHLRVLEMLRYRSNLERRAIDGATPLWVAAECGNLSCVRSLAEAGADLDARTIDQRTPLHIAAANRHLDVVLELLKRGANHNATAVDGSTPVHLLMSKRFSTSACGGSELEKVLSALLEAGVEMEATRVDGTNALHEAVRHHNIDEIKFMLEQGSVNPNQCSEDGCAPLHEAVLLNDLEAVSLLVSCESVDLNVRCTSSSPQHGATPLFLAALKGHSEALKLLLTYGADVNIDRNDVTPLMAAIDAGHTGCISMLQATIKSLLSQNKRADFGGKKFNYPSFVLNCRK
mmetsp:Transcript_38734/g.91763  ORF Transcript_38734/g.91763 Transcript_38734/m.91763 type:complete len:679 (-) Transcript_38734:409-2445(-)